MGFGQEDGTAALWPPVAMGLAARALQRWDARSGPRNTGKAEGCLERRDAALVVGTTIEGFAFGTLVEVTSEDDSAQLMQGSQG